ncbi:hypothetical protein CTA1_4659 [Colletotrichum tanaceti]|uniref:Uncharacterized protein n=1 Tax=Colletotrichum tanaceti TaxID=1306861 RepID=A0A4U6X4V5_9PEZI|nr:hypothetical protein CTA1_4659 [Colletotrichum tanaceti]
MGSPGAETQYDVPASGPIAAAPAASTPPNTPAITPAIPATAPPRRGPTTDDSWYGRRVLLGQLRRGHYDS